MNKKVLTVIILLLVAAGVVYGVSVMRKTKPNPESGVPAGRLMSPLGTWTQVDVADSQHVLTFTDDNRYREISEGDMVTATGTWTIGETDGGATITLTTDGKGAQANRTWKVIKLSTRELQVAEISGSGARLRFVK